MLNSCKTVEDFVSAWLEIYLIDLFEIGDGHVTELIPEFQRFRITWNNGNRLGNAFIRYFLPASILAKYFIASSCKASSLFARTYT